MYYPPKGSGAPLESKGRKSGISLTPWHEQARPFIIRLPTPFLTSFLFYITIIPLSVPVSPQNTLMITATSWHSLIVLCYFPHLGSADAFPYAWSAFSWLSTFIYSHTYNSVFTWWSPIHLLKLTLYISFSEKPSRRAQPQRLPQSEPPILCLVSYLDIPLLSHLSSQVVVICLCTCLLYQSKRQELACSAWWHLWLHFC